MTFYYKEPKAGNLWVFALDGGAPRRGPCRHQPDSPAWAACPGWESRGARWAAASCLDTGLPPPKVGSPSRARPHPQPTSATEAPASAELDAAIVQGEQIYPRALLRLPPDGRGTGANLFRTSLGPARFKEVVVKGREGTTMPAFGALLTTDEIWAIFDFVLSRDRLE